MTTWYDLSGTKRLQLARQLAAGNTSPDNINRALEALANNPDLLYRTAREAGIADEISRLEEDSISKNVDKSLRTKSIPSPRKDETMREYVERLQREIDKVDRGSTNDVYEDTMFGVGKNSEAELLR